MSETADDILTKPLGVTAPKKRRLPAIRIPSRIVGGALAVVVVAAVSALALFGDRHGGEPRLTATIEKREPTPTKHASASPAAEASTPESPSLQSSASQVEQASGVIVTRPDGSGAPDEPVIIRVPPPDLVRLNAAPDPRLIERGRHGMLPKLADGRVRALDVYARPEVPGSVAPAKVALLVSGVGISDLATASAIARLPPAISLGLAAYGNEIDKTAQRARQAGHEILLQVPMEPFDYPDSDPGPQTLLTSSRPAENVDRLSWAMSRFSGFVGIVNYMGGKLTSEAGALEPILKEIAARGLGFVDDGTSPQSLVSGLAPKVKLPAVRSEMVVDAVARPEAIDKELARLEAQARQKGFALATASAMPMTIDRIARWARDLESRGIQLVPVSVALRQPSLVTQVTSAER